MKKQDEIDNKGGGRKCTKCCRQCMTRLGKGQCQVWKHGNSRFYTDDYNLPSNNDSFGERKLKIWLTFNEMGSISQFWQESKAHLVANFNHRCLK